MGFQGITEENVINPGLVMGAYFRDRPDYARQPVYLLGNENVKNTLESIGNVCLFGTGPDLERNSAEDLSKNPKAVVSSREPYLSYSKIMKAAYFLRRNEVVEFLVTDEDFAHYLCQVQALSFLVTGHPSRIIQVASGRAPKVFGKPHRPMADFF
ncbi:hypothetical protein OSTOST_23436 [Ostertagia ostertagi]